VVSLLLPAGRFLVDDAGGIDSVCCAFPPGHMAIAVFLFSRLPKKDFFPVGGPGGAF